MRFHRAGCRFGHQKHALQIGVDDLVPIGFRLIEKRRLAHHTRIIDEDIDPAQQSGHRRDTRGVRYVEDSGTAPSALTLNSARHRGERLGAPGGDDNLRACRCQDFGEVRAEPP